MIHRQVTSERERERIEACACYLVNMRLDRGGDKRTMIESMEMLQERNAAWVASVEGCVGRL